MKRKKIPSDIQKMSFEEALAELEVQVGKLDEGSCKTVMELTDCFERSFYLSTHCRNILTKLDKRISLLTSDDGKDGQWEDFDPESGRREDDLF